MYQRDEALNIQRDVRLDYAKALAISFVLFLHLEPIKILGTGFLSRITNFGIKQIHFQIAAGAVPLFLLVSLYLFYQKTEVSALHYLDKRWRRLVEVFVFWTCCQFACFYGLYRLIKLSQGVYNI